MIVIQGAKDEQNRQERTKKTIDAIRTEKSISLMLEPASSCNLSTVLYGLKMFYSRQQYYQ